MALEQAGTNRALAVDRGIRAPGSAATEAGDRREALQRIASVALIMGGILFLSNLLFPRPDNLSDYPGFVALLVENAARAKVVALAIPVGLLALVAGVAAISRSITEDPASNWARLGVYGLLVGSAGATIQFALIAGAINEAGRGASDAGVFLLATAMHVRPLAMLIAWLGLGTAGLGMAMSGLYSRWAGWTIFVLGIAMAAVSSASIIGGATPPLAAATGVLATLTAVWAVLAGISIARGKSRAT